MQKTPVDTYWQLKMARCKEALEENNFSVYLAEDPTDAKKIVLTGILPKTGAKSMAWGDSMTMLDTGILDALKQDPALEVIETFDSTVPREEIIERRRRALITDLFLTGSNAVTETGMLVNLDMVGNRVAGIVFGPKNVVIFVGRNKIVADIGEAMSRVKELAAPANAIRHHMKTPCVKTGRCMDCKSPDRICNVWTVTEKSYPKGRIHIILIKRDMGL